MNGEIRLSPEYDRWAESEARGSDDETVDRRIVSSVKKTCSCTNQLSENHARGSHHDLAATAVHSREAGYI
jgi:hypothetical protein